MRHALLFFALLLAAPLTAQDGPANVLVNPGFEDGEDAPVGWSFNHRRTDGEIAWDRDRAHGGAASVRIRNQSPAQSGNVVQTLHFDPPLLPGTRVSYSAWAAAQDVQGNGPRIIINLLSTDGVRQDAFSAGAGGSHDFTLVQGEALALRESDRVVIYLCNYDTGTVWWDDAHVATERAVPTTVLPRPQVAGRLAALNTDDGLGLTFSESGAVAGLSIDGASVATGMAHTGLWVRPFGGDTVPVTGELRAADGVISQQFTDEELGLRVTTSYVADGDAVTCAGAVEDLTGQERGVDIIFSLPVGGEGWRWGRNIREEQPLTDQSVSQDTLTWSSVSAPEGGDGVCLAVPPDSPCVCEFTWGRELGYAVRFRFGLSPSAGGEFRGRAPFRFVISRCDGIWGLRDATRRYYARYPAAFERRAERDGLWLFGAARFELPDPENYTFHEGGPRGWEYDEEHGIYTCPYIIPGQREVRRLAGRPADRQEAMELFRAWENPAAGQAGSWGADMKQIIENCLLLDADGVPEMSLRHTEWGGESITFPLNANPRLFEDTDAITLGKAQLAEVRAMHDATAELDGTYVDSLGAWGEYDNFRTEHFAYTRTPLTYHLLTGRPVINNRFTLLEFLWGLGEMMHERGDLVFANGVHQNRRFHAFACDVLGVEGRNFLEQKRAIAGRKPFLLLIYDIQSDPQQMEYWYNLCGLYGLYPSFGNLRVFETPESYAPVAALNNRYVPAMRKATEAGWRPITHVRSSDAEVWLERWGPGAAGELYLTVYNSAEQERAIALTVTAAELGLTGTLTAADELSGVKTTGRVENGAAELQLTVPPRRLMVLRLTSD